MNRVMLIGRTGSDVEFKELESGNKVAKVSLATSRKVKDNEVTQWHNLVCWNRVAEIVNDYVKKGDQIAVEGEITYRSYEQDGQKKYFTEITVFNMEMLGGKREESTEEKTPVLESSGNVKDESDLPF